MASANRSDDELHQAYAYCLRLLGRREYCTADMRRRLEQRGYSAAIVADTIRRLQMLDALSEARFAEGFFRSRQARGEAPWVTAVRARQRGVAEEEVAAAQSKAEEDFDALACCRRLLMKRDPQGLRFADKKIWARCARFLKARGFTAAIIMAAMNERHAMEES